MADGAKTGSDVAHCHELVNNDAVTLGVLQQVLDDIRAIDRRETELSGWTPSALAGFVERLSLPWVPVPLPLPLPELRTI